MKTLYVTEQGATLRRAGHVLQVWRGGKRLSELIVHDLDQLVLMGNILVTPPVLDFLIREKIDTVFLSIHGRFRGRLMHDHSKNITLRLEQYRKLQDPTHALDVARRIVAGKIGNARAFLLRAGRSEAVRAAAERMGAMRKRLQAMTTLDQVRGCEGRAAALYFEVFGELLTNPEFEFSGRNRRPPLDPVNVLLSLGYTLLTNAVETAVQVVGLDPYLGALHEVTWGRPSLVCDLVEEHRASVVDPLVVAAINQRSFRREDFEERGEGEPVVLRREAMRHFVDLFERRMQGRIFYPPRGDRITWRQLLEEQVRAFARWILGSQEAYEPFRVR